MPPKGHSVTILRNRITGRYAGRTETEFESGHNDPIDDAPPPGFHRNELTITTPLRLGSVTPKQLEESVKKGGPSTQAAHIAEALENKEE